MCKEIRKTDISKAVNVSKNDVFVSSDFIAEAFDKRHSDVVSKIREEIKFLTTENFVVKTYFHDASYINSRGQKYPRFDLTRKGFDAVVLGMTGSKAKKYKYWFIDEFHNKSKILAEQKAIVKMHQENDMWLAIRDEAKDARTALTDAIKQYELPQRVKEGKNTERFVATRIMNYTSMVYKALKIEWQDGVSLRDVLGPRELLNLEDTEYKVAKMIQELTELQGCHYKQTYQLIKKSLL